MSLQFTPIEIHVSPWNAHISRALLASEGIPSFLESEHHVTANWSMSRVLGGVRLMVETTHLAEAHALLAMRDRGELEAALHDEFPPGVSPCKQCGSALFVPKRRGGRALLAMVMLFTMGIIFPPGKRQRCSACGHPQEVG